MEILFFILFLAGQVSVIYSVIRDNDYTKIKAILIAVYLFLGINIPIVAHDIFVLKVGHSIPLISPGIALYKLALCLVGLGGIVMPIYKTIKKQSAQDIEGKELHSSKESGQN